MSALVQQRCVTHPEREAAARCPECGHFYCRECVTEHEERVICASCMAKLSEAPAEDPPTRLHPFRTTFQVAAGLIAAWIFFYLLGSLLLTIPSSFHEGRILDNLEATP